MKGVTISEYEIVQAHYMKEKLLIGVPDWSIQQIAHTLIVQWQNFLNNNLPTREKKVNYMLFVTKENL